MSISLGISKSKYENILVMDGDLQHDPNYLPRIMEIFIKKNSDFLICVEILKKFWSINSKIFFVKITYIFS